jgi:hypothetical protein
MYGRVDWDDRLFGVAFLLASAVSVGFLTVPGTSMFSETMLTIGDGTAAAEFSLAKLVSLVALMAAIVSNRTDFSKLTSVEWWVAVVTIGLVIAPPFSPLIDAFLNSSVIAGAFAIAIQAGGFFIISYLG